VRRLTVIVLVFGSLVIGALGRQAAGQIAPNAVELRPIDDARLRAGGIRKITSRHLSLYTDLPADPEIDRLPAVFDQAVPQWAKYYGVAEEKTRGWQARAFLIKDRERFNALGLMPPRGADRFLNGISIYSELWLYEQPTVYYRRHLLLHEGTHAFMVAFLGGCGPGWYMEGNAELMGTHRLDGASGRLTLRIMPDVRDDVPMLGRIKLIRDAVAAGRPLGLAAVMRIDNRKLLENEAYAWSWASVRFLDSHPRYRERFRKLQQHVLDPRFNEIVAHEFGADWPEMLTEWRAFVDALDHGYDFERMAIDFHPGAALAPGRRQSVTIRADRGWQSSGVRLEAGRSYRVTASGRFQVAEEAIATGQKQPWSSEAGGVTIEYYDGRPLGILLGAIDARDNAKSGFDRPIAIGLGTTIRPDADGTLYLRVNDSAGRLDDNRGTLTVVIEAVDNK
jgi:hypothetical protein